MTKKNPASTMLSRDGFRKFNSVTVEKVELPDGQFVFVRGISAAERDEWDQALMGPADKKGNRKMSFTGARALLARMAACDEKGAPIFRPGDEAWLKDKPAVIINRIFTAAQKLAGMTNEEVEEIEKNLKEDQSDGSPSD